MKLKKLVSLTLATAVLSTLLVSGTVSAEESSGVTLPLDETMEFTMFAIVPGADYPLENNLSFNKLNEDANITFDIQSVLPADLGEKRGLVLSSGEYPDVFFKSAFSATDLAKYGAEGVLIPLQDLIRENMPNLTALLDERDAWQYLEDQDGNIYSLPEIDFQTPGVTVLWINQLWMDNLGLSEPTSLDELHDVLKAFKEQDPNGNGEADEIPLIATSTNTTIELLMPYFDVISFDSSTHTALNENNELYYLPTSDVFYDYLEYVTMLYSEGLLDKNCFTQAGEQQAAIGQSGDVLGAFFDAGAFLTVGRDNDDDYIALTPFTEGTYPVSSGITVGTLCITDVCEHPEIILAWADQLYSEEGGILAWLGVEGETYTLNDDGTWDWITGGDYGDDVSTVRTSSTVQGTANHPSVQPNLWFEGMTAATDADEVYLTEQRNKLVSIGADPRPSIYYSEADAQTLSTLSTDLSSYWSQYMAQVVTGELDLAESWDEYLSTMNQMGAEQLESIYAEAYAFTQE